MYNRFVFGHTIQDIVLHNMHNRETESEETIVQKFCTLCESRWRNELDVHKAGHRQVIFCIP